MPGGPSQNYHRTQISDKLSKVGWWSFQCIFPYCCLDEKLARLPGTTS